MLTNITRYSIGKIQTNNINIYIGTCYAYLSFSRGTWPLLYVSLPRDVALLPPSVSCQSLPHLLRSSTRSEEQKNIRENIQNNSKISTALYHSSLQGRFSIFYTFVTLGRSSESKSHGMTFYPVIPAFRDMQLILNLKKSKENYDIREKYSKKYERKASAQ